MNFQKKSEKTAILYAILAILFWSTVASAFKLTLKSIDSISILTFSSLVSLIFLLLVLIIKKQLRLLFNQSRKEWLYSSFLGFLNPFLYYLILFNAYDLLPAQEAMVLNYTWPLVLSVFSALIFKRKIPILGYIALLISFLGIIIIATKGNLFELKFDSPYGVLLAIGSAGVWALFWILNMQDKREPLLKLTSGFIVGSFFSMILFFFTIDISSLSYPGILGATYIGIFEMGLTFLLWLTALSKTEKTNKISQLVYISPFLSLIFISIILGETILLSSFVGLLFIITGIVIQSKIK